MFDELTGRGEDAIFFFFFFGKTSWLKMLVL